MLCLLDNKITSENKDHKKDIHKDQKNIFVIQKHKNNI